VPDGREEIPNQVLIYEVVTDLSADI
jgi:hypothetical protein